METLLRLKPYSTPPFAPLHLHPSSRSSPSFAAIVANSPRNQSGKKLRFHGTNITIPIKKRRTIHRNVVVRSEIAAAGSTDDSACSMTEFQLGSRIRAICFYSVTIVVAIFLFVGMVVVHPFVLLFDRLRRRAHHLIAKLWATLTIAPFYEFEFEGVENLPPQNMPAVYVSNHQSFLDIYTLLTLGRCFKIISKRSIFLFPIIGWAMLLMGVIPLRRMDSRSQLDCLKRCMDLLRKGASVFFFPEGTRSKDGKLGAFKKGAFSVAAKTGVPVVPMTLLGTGKLMPAGMEGVLNPGSVKVIVHQPIEGNDADMLCCESRNVIANALLDHGYGVHGA
ncbi:1-acyl-sn-glycerol-3-phosphate acyltransferase BAT2, chloroplastic-like [Phoenix dactylifera]|uniref:1-acyl-sn-glycerol-3-phosphate acyltransferase n=1 Tax=Phoenix dactylifera TaxID=42345 RepID=A0A8B9A8C8_PHODC|nr:1-acyl-sn-glycerol-3-phosphate acyltransferase BAT2, chloroplastic-like [Phoenix dactylifera]XP_008808285.1 1-acyl-sn-glycerol-3-phosphate acyltransferase BAT2, chloroplastic-like [Phoenix dactylifera]XP_038979429.1 1-acyl-sn-glycerol-3-phosphate acyltransferase BAT2, chloroplastic-like [Phoenix dactylifera]